MEDCAKFIKNREVSEAFFCLCKIFELTGLGESIFTDYPHIGISNIEHPISIAEVETFSQRLCLLTN